MAKKAKSTLFNMLLSLTLIALVAAAALAFVNKITKDPIALAQQKKKEAAIKAVLPPFETIKEVIIDNDTLTTAFDAEGRVVGMAVGAASEKGFGGRLGLMVGFDTTGAISGYQVLETAETPGLGAKAGTWFQKDGKGCIIGKNAADGLKVKKDGGDVDAISGSTITSRAFCEAINNAYNTFQKGGNQ